MAAITATDAHGAHDEHPSDVVYWKVFGVLLALTALEVSTYWWPEDWHKVTAVLLIIMMVIKFATVALYFMHLKSDAAILKRVFIAGMVLAVSRILLALPKVGSYLVFGLVPAAILAIGTLIVMKPKLSQSVIAGLLLFCGVAILAGGVAAAIAGERDSGEHEEHHSSEGEGEAGLAPLPAPTSAVIIVGNR